MTSLLLTTIVGLSIIEAQQIIASSGDYFKTTNANISWTIGEPVIETFTNSSNIITQGFNQTKLTITSVDKFLLDGVEISIYPNPASDKLLIEVKSNKLGEFNYTIYDMGGNKIAYELVNGWLF